MSHKRLAMFLLAGSLTLAGCGSPTAPQPGNTAPNLQAPAVTQPAVEPPAVVNPVEQPAAPAIANGDLGLSGGAAAPPVAPVAPVAPGPGIVWGGHDFIVFHSNRDSYYDNDIFVYDPYLDTVLALPAVNTPANEINPRISDNGKWLVFQRGEYGGYQDIFMYNLATKLINTLPMLNSEEFDEYMPDVTDDGAMIVYVTNLKGYPELRLYDCKTGDNWAVPGADRNFADISWPTISANGSKLAYGASVIPGYGYATDGTGNLTGGPAFTGNPLYFGESNIYVYDIIAGVQLTPPFINTAFDEYNPDLSWDGACVLFVSNRLGSEDIFEVNLATGFTDNFSFLNTYDLDEQHPRYIGGAKDRLYYQIKPRDLTYPVALRAFDRLTATIDTLPVANQLFADSALRAPQPELIDLP